MYTIETGEKMITITRSKSLQSFKAMPTCFDGDMTSSNFDVLPDNLLRYNSVDRDNFILELSQFASLYRAYLLVKFHVVEHVELKVRHFR